MTIIFLLRQFEAAFRLFFHLKCYMGSIADKKNLLHGCFDYYFMKFFCRGVKSVGECTVINVSKFSHIPRIKNCYMYNLLKIRGTL